MPDDRFDEPSSDGITKQQIDDAIRKIDEFKQALSRFIPLTNQQDIALEDACADAARLAARLRELQDELDALMSA